MENKRTQSGLLYNNFNKIVDEKETNLYVLKNELGMEVAVTNYGAKIVSILVPDKNGKMTDVVTGHNSIDEYLTSEEPYFGAICGRYANRIAKGQFTIDGKSYQLPINNGPNSLHGGIKGYNSMVWDVKETTENTIKLSYLSIDGEEGYPGNLTITVTYTLSADKNALRIDYHAATDKPTVLNLTNHSYFNLSGSGDEYIGDHMLEINADYYLPTDETAIPYGEKEAVEGTPMDFRTPMEVGARINDDFQQLIYGKGYDHTYVLNNESKNAEGLDLCARCSSPKTGIEMTCYTSEPGVQLYTGNWMTGNFVAKGGVRYPMRAALCLETQHFPDSPNQPSYPTTELYPGKENDYLSTTTFEFGIKED